RDWYDGKSPAPVPARPEPAEPARAERAEPAHRDPLLDLPPPTAPPLYPTAFAAGPSAGQPTGRRPASVTWACVLAWLSTAAVFGVLAMVIGVPIAAPGDFLDAAHRANPDLA